MFDHGMSVFMDGDNQPFFSSSGEVPQYKNKLPYRLKPQPMLDVHVDMLDLSNADDLTYYSKIWRAVGYRVASVLSEEKHWVEETKSWKILLRWVIVGTMDPKDLRNTACSVLNETMRAGKERTNDEQTGGTG